MTARTTTLLALLLVSSLGACGFHLRGDEAMPFHAIYVESGNPNSLLVSDLRRNLKDHNVMLVESADQADVILNIVSEVSDKQILTLGGSGRVNEFELNYRVSLHAYDLKQQDWLRAEDIAMSRDYSYDDTQILAKEAEEQLLYQSMRSDMAQQIIRRLSRSRPLAK